MPFTLPRYFVIGERPVKMVRGPSGEMDILAYQWKEGGFQRDFSYLTRILHGQGEIEEVDERTFSAAVERLDRTHPHPAPGVHASQR